MGQEPVPNAFHAHLDTHGVIRRGKTIFWKRQSRSSNCETRRLALSRRNGPRRSFGSATLYAPGARFENDRQVMDERHFRRSASAQPSSLRDFGAGFGATAFACSCIRVR